MRGTVQAVVYDHWLCVAQSQCVELVDSSEDFTVNPSLPNPQCHHINIGKHTSTMKIHDDVIRIVQASVLGSVVP